MVLDLTKGIKFYLKKKYVACFGSWNHRGEIASLQGLQYYGKSRKKSFARLIDFFFQIRYRLYFNDKNHV